MAKSVSIIAAVVAALFVVPGVPDSYELPRRLIWGFLAVCLAGATKSHGDNAEKGRRDALQAWQRRLVVASGLALLFYMIMRWLFSGPVLRTSLPLHCWVLPPLLFVISISTSWRRTDVTALAKTFAWLGAAEAAIMLLQRFGFAPSPAIDAASGYAPERMVGTVGYQNQAAEFLCLSLGALWISRQTACAWTGKPGRRLLAHCIVELVMATLIVCAIAATANRGAVLGVLALALTLAAIHGNRRRLALPLFMVCFAAVVCAAPELRQRAVELAMMPMQSPAVRTRLLLLRVALNQLVAHPVFGVGAGSFAYEFMPNLAAIIPAHLDHAALRFIVFAQETHCDPVQFVAEFGIAGAALAACFATCVVRLALARHKLGDSLAIPALATLVALTTCSLFSFSWQTSLAAPGAALLAGAALAPAKSEANGTGIQCRIPRACGSGLFARASMLAMAGAMLAIVLFENCGNLLCSQIPGDINSPVVRFFLHGRWEAEAAYAALCGGDSALALRLAEEAGRDCRSPAQAMTHGAALLNCGRATEAAEVFSRLARTGLMHNNALKNLSVAYEKAGDAVNAAGTELERFGLFAHSFSDGECYRLATMLILADRALEAERITLLFFRRAECLGEKWRITPEWENLRGAALVAAGRRKEAIPFFKRALKRKPSLTSARRNMDALLCPTP